MKTIVENKYSCPVCGDHEFIKFFADDGLYICKKYETDDKHAEAFAAIYCKTCQKEYSFLRYGSVEHSLYVCKQCNQTHWGLTEYWRDSLNYASQLSLDRKHQFVKKENKYDPD